MNYLEASAEIDGPYRYLLVRDWRVFHEEDKRTILWVMLNPSTADGTKDDPTIRRCVTFSERWGFNRMEVVNLFAWRATKPKDLFRPDDVIGPRNDSMICWAARAAHKILVAWGSNKAANPERVREVLKMLRCQGPVHCLSPGQYRYPRHPLYVRGSENPRLVP